MSCTAEMCPYWTGHGCICAVLNLELQCIHEMDDELIDGVCIHCGEEFC